MAVAGGDGTAGGERLALEVLDRGGGMIGTRFLDRERGKQIPMRPVVIGSGAESSGDGRQAGQGASQGFIHLPRLSKGAVGVSRNVPVRPGPPETISSA